MIYAIKLALLSFLLLLLLYFFVCKGVIHKNKLELSQKLNFRWTALLMPTGFILFQAGLLSLQFFADSSETWIGIGLLYLLLIPIFLISTFSYHVFTVFKYKNIKMMMLNPVILLSYIIPSFLMLPIWVDYFDLPL